MLWIKYRGKFNKFTRACPVCVTDINNDDVVKQFVMDKNEAAPSIYRKWRDYFQDYTFDDEIQMYGFYSETRMVVLEYLMKEDQSSHWFNDVSTLTMGPAWDIGLGICLAVGTTSNDTAILFDANL